MVCLISQCWTVLRNTQEGTWNPGITCLFVSHSDSPPTASTRVNNNNDDNNNYKSGNKKREEILTLPGKRIH